MHTAHTPGSGSFTPQEQEAKANGNNTGLHATRRGREQPGDQHEQVY